MAFKTAKPVTCLIENTPVVERSRNQRGVLVVSELAQNLKGRPLEGLTRPTEASEWGATMATRLKRDFECLGIDYNAFYPGETRLQALEELQSAPEVNEYQVFFYHSDHLGSSSFITDANGDATQHLQYLPFGEDLVHEQNTAAYLSPYTFSGKERDVETNLSYFGARYYESGLSVWLSVDPMADEAPGWTPYRYAFQNPVKYIDPNGRFELDEETAKKFPELAKFLQGLKDEFINKPEDYKKAFYETSGLTEEETLEMLTYGSGPKVEVENLDKDGKMVNGITVGERDSDGKLVNKNDGKGLIKLDDDVVKMLEGAKTMGDKQIGTIMVESTLMHEGTHYGNIKKTNTPNGSFNESGKAFEIGAYGRDINRSGVRQYWQSNQPTVVPMKTINQVTR